MRAQSQDALDSEPVELTTRLVSQRYCKGDFDVDVAELDLSFCFTNVSTEPLIVYKKGPFVLRQVVSENIESAQIGWYES